MTALSTSAPGSLPRKGHLSVRAGRPGLSCGGHPLQGTAALGETPVCGDYAYEQLTGKSAYDQTDWTRYETLLAGLEQDIVYKGGIEFPREDRRLKQYLPRLCAAHQTGMARHAGMCSKGNAGSHPCRKGV